MPILGVILDDTDRINPKITNTKEPSDSDGILECLRHRWDIYAAFSHPKSVLCSRKGLDAAPAMTKCNELLSVPGQGERR
jgi:hypothetical protein